MHGGCHNCQLTLASYLAVEPICIEVLDVLLARTWCTLQLLLLASVVSWSDALLVMQLTAA